MILFSGHGGVTNATQRVELYDDSNFPLELRIRDFANVESEKAYVWGIFDACRSVYDLNPE